MKIEVDAEKLANEIATEIFELQLQCGSIKYSKMLTLVVEEFHGIHEKYELTQAGQNYMNKLQQKWEEKILDV